MSKRSFDSVWDSDACIYNCLAHSIFNLTSPKSGAGAFDINSTAKLVDVKVVNSTSSVVDIGPAFGCQRTVQNQVTMLSPAIVALSHSIYVNGLHQMQHNPARLFHKFSLILNVKLSFSCDFCSSGQWRLDPPST